MGLGTGATAAIIGGIGAAGSVASSVMGSNAASDAAGQQTQSAQNALDFQKSVYGSAQQNQQPYVAAGQSSIGQLMQGFSSGTFGPGSQAPMQAPTGTGAFAAPASSNKSFVDPTTGIAPFSNPTAGITPFSDPTADMANFKAPTAAEAEATPGYQFALEQGMRGVGSSAAAAGGALSGANIKESAQYAQGLASTTYGQTFADAMQGYQANLANKGQQFGQALQTSQEARAAQGQQFGQAVQGYQENLAGQGQQFGQAAQGYQENLANQGQQFGQAATGYGLNLAASNQNYGQQLAQFQANQAQQAQQFGQVMGTAQLGQAGIQSINNTGAGTATNVGNLMVQQGNAQAAGTVGSANAINSGISGVASSGSQALLLNALGPTLTKPPVTYNI